MTFSTFRRMAFAAGFAVVALTACAGSDVRPDDPFAGEGPALAMVPANHTDRWAVNIFVEKYWAGDVSPRGGGAKAACCFPSMKDWSKPVTVTWTWDAVEDPKTKAVIVPEEKRRTCQEFRVLRPVKGLS
ncbi:hypothetical protein BTHA_4162 [Burkholderia thailandensis MSMB59]|uniref:DUF3304 domain-containing protein n=1 Tax=Burkholderia thailandensis TaxID=57975 RepID=UPI00051551E3|nr:DUF3304 domain-containing protein [Burkholderia thailandensis]AIS98739.1 hypothetical protein BTHA_4162 [Burkholderia thailandensis MSMB59]